MSVARCQEEVSVEEFLDWNVYFDRQDWERHSKTEQQLALIAYEVHSVAYIFRRFLGATNIQMPEFDAFLLKFGKGDETKDAEVYRPADASKIVHPENVGNFAKADGYAYHDTDSGVLDEKWRKINEEAKAKWFAVLPPEVIQSYTEREDSRGRSGKPEGA